MNDARVDFYLLPATSWQECLPFARGLIEKAYRQGHALTIALDTPKLTEMLDTALWCDRPETFLPHECDTHAATITVARHQQAPTLRLQMTLDPAPTEGWERLLQIVPSASTLKIQARQRYREFQARGLTPETHQPKKS